MTLLKKIISNDPDFSFLGNENIRLKNSGITNARKQMQVGKEVPANAVHH